MKALVIGGTGPTGPHIINGLIERGYDVVMLNRGSRDSDAIPADVERVIGDPHFPDTLNDALGTRTFDLVVATYGRIRYVAEVVSTRTDRLITVGGPPSYRGFADPYANFPPGMAVPTPEDAPRVESEAESRFGNLIRITEDAVMEQHASGAMNVTHFRYPVVYGPWQVRPTTLWWVMQRCLDGRSAAAVADGGLTLFTRGYSENMAHAVLLAAEQPEASAGQIYNCGDDRQMSLAQWISTIAGAMGSDMEIVSVPDAYASPSKDLMQFSSADFHQFLDLTKLKTQLGYTDRVDSLEAIRRTVQWLTDNPPTEQQYIDDVRKHYAVEDALITICRDASEKMAALSHITEEFHHSYAHPRERGLERDHLNR
jgi:nucleoside-diphosphate-sugar epimerase